MGQILQFKCKKNTNYSLESAKTIFHHLCDQITLIEKQGLFDSIDGDESDMALCAIFSITSLEEEERTIEDYNASVDVLLSFCNKYMIHHPPEKLVKYPQ